MKPESPLARVRRACMTNRIIPLAFVLCAMPVVLTAQQAESPEARFEGLTRAYFAAVAARDSVTLFRMMHPEFLLSSSDSDGALTPRDGYVRGVSRGTLLQVHRWDVRDFRVTMLDDVAIVRCRIVWESTYRGRPWNATFLNTDVWVRAGTEWRVISRHSSYPASELSRIVRERYDTTGRR